MMPVLLLLTRSRFENPAPSSRKKKEGFTRVCHNHLKQPPKKIGETLNHRKGLAKKQQSLGLAILPQVEGWDLKPNDATFKSTSEDSFPVLSIENLKGRRFS